ncbi:MAG: 16S rRNA (guanine(527)-N(7))-methyltransferase RsmG [Porticoccaceae bacterium]|jgi:16S rRNA (guanine527-N7)-methyltransferase|nr:16S rRNA (guanine(527)-N(7))-methyltransferase RsmG [Porticoccaceae bacterium]MBT5577887.1 16S rRNA (guanine(527)-N(7))-methyltransferase RsmG [Porticoccaceae bacterium]MBT7375147.1 16S rRNA (guanine(527)-N(7))-methyltransferase RsmG [Porticoccaceae bacterium]
MQPNSDSPYGKGSTSAKKSKLQHGIKLLGIECTADQVDKLLVYLEMLEHWNKAYNLTAIRDPMQMIDLHLLDSLAILKYIEKSEAVIDVGTGPGLPGIPLAIMNPKKSFTLLDSNGKKTRFLFQVIAELGLDNVQEVNSRVELFTPEVLFDTVLSRAFSSIPDMLHNCDHLIFASGCFMAMKGKNPQSELSKIEKAYKVDELHRLDVPGVDGERHLVKIIKKMQSPSLEP